MVSMKRRLGLEDSDSVPDRPYKTSKQSVSKPLNISLPPLAASKSNPKRRQAWDEDEHNPTSVPLKKCLRGYVAERKASLRIVENVPREKFCGTTNCVHKHLTLCNLTQDRCCVCADRRPQAVLYNGVFDDHPQDPSFAQRKICCTHCEAYWKKHRFEGHGGIPDHCIGLPDRALLLLRAESSTGVYEHGILPSFDFKSSILKGLYRYAREGKLDQLTSKFGFPPIVAAAFGEVTLADIDCLDFDDVKTYWEPSQVNDVEMAM